MIERRQIRLSDDLAQMAQWSADTRRFHDARRWLEDRMIEWYHQQARARYLELLKSVGKGD